MLSFDLPVLLFTLSGAVGLMNTPDRSAALPLFLAIFCGGFLYIAGALLGRAPRAALAVTAVLVATGVVIAAYFLTQSHRFPYPDKIGAITRLRVVAGSIAPAVGGWAPFPASVATALECLVFAALGLAAGPRSGASARLWLAAAALLCLGILATASRGAWAATGLTAAVWMARRSRGLRAFAVAAAVLGACLLAPLARAELHRQALTLIYDAPFTGVGLGGFESSLSKYVLLIQVPFLSYAHNLLLDAWLRQSLAGATALVWLGASIVAAIVLTPPSAIHPSDQLRLGCFCGVFCVLLHGTTDARPYVDAWCGVAFFLVLGLGRGLPHVKTPAASLVSLVTALAFTVAAVAWSGSPIAAWTTSRAAVLQARGDDTVAEAGFLRAIRQDPEYGSAHFRLGILLMNREAFPEARLHLDAAYRAAPGKPGRRKALGLAVLWTGDPAYAAELLKNEPGMVDELNAWAAWRAGRGQHELAASALEARSFLTAGHRSP